MKSFFSYVGGSFRSEDKKGECVHLSPYNGQALHQWFDGLDLLEETLSNSEKAFSQWKGLSREERKAPILRFQKALVAREDQITQCLIDEIGKARWEARIEAQALVKKIEISLGSMLTLVERMEETGRQTGTQHFQFLPKGPCLVLGPFNFPLHLPNGQIIPALLMGNPVIFKPSEYGNACASLYAEAAHEAEFPPGVFQMILGDAKTAKELVKDSRIKSIQFTGSYENGKRITQARLETGDDLDAIVALEMGGKNAFVVHKDADLHQSVAEGIMSAYATAGQRCSCASRILVHHEVFEDFSDSFLARLKKLSFGDPNLEKTFMGPLVHAKAKEAFLKNLNDLKNENARVLLDSTSSSENSCLTSPSVYRFDSADQALKALSLQKEFFGPNCVLVPYRSNEELLRLHEATPFGLVSSVYTKNRDFFEFCDREFEVGLLNWNRPTVGASSDLPFGGVKRSGNNWPVGIFAFLSSVHCRSYLMSQSPFETSSLPASLQEIML